MDKNKIVFSDLEELKNSILKDIEERYSAISIESAKKAAMDQIDQAFNKREEDLKALSNLMPEDFIKFLQKGSIPVISKAVVIGQGSSNLEMRKGSYSLFPRYDLPPGTWRFLVVAIPIEKAWELRRDEFLIDGDWFSWDRDSKGRYIGERNG